MQYSQRGRCQHGSVASLCLHLWDEKAAVILMSTKIEIIVSISVSPLLLKPVLGIVLPQSALLKIEQPMSWLQSGHHAFSFFPLVAVECL